MFSPVNNGIVSSQRYDPNIISGLQADWDSTKRETLNAKLSASFVSTNSESLTCSTAWSDHSGNLHFTFWVYPTSASAQPFFRLTDSTTGYFIGAQKSGANLLTVRLNTSAGAEDTNTAVSVTLNAWNLISIRWDEGTNTIWYSVNGVGQTSSVKTGNLGMTGATTTLIIGYDGATYYSGRIEEFAMSYTVFNNTVIGNIYNGGSGVNYDGWVSATGVTPEAYYDMDELEGQSRLDSSGNGHTLLDNNTVGVALGFVGSPINEGEIIWRWVDSSPNAYVVQQDTVASQPSYTAGLVGGRSGVDFDGTDDILTRSGSWRSSDSSCTWMIVCNPVSQALFGVSQSTVGDKLITLGMNSAFKPTIIWQLVSGSFTQLTGDIALSSAGVLVLRSDGSAWDFTTNETANTIAISGTAPDPNNGTWLHDLSAQNNFSIGGRLRSSGNSFWAGEFGRILYWNRALSNDEVAYNRKGLYRQFSITP